MSKRDFKLSLETSGITSKSLLEELKDYVPTKPSHIKSLKILIRDKGVCQLCEKEIHSLKSFSRDHKTPKSKGGNNTFANLQAAHKKCNQMKGDKLEELPPSYFTERKSRAKKKPVQLPPTQKTDWCVELYNEIQRHSTTRLSFVMFKQYFEKYKTLS